ncbi:MAG: 4'-phosphopantetheinyl transferase superfamily protein [Verrucomicrobiales bacterium]
MRTGIDTVEIARIEKLLGDLDASELGDFFSEEELRDAGEGVSRAQKLAARFAAKEACCKLFPKELCLGKIEPVDFSVGKDGYGEPHVVPGPRARAAMDLHRIGEIRLSLTHTEASATAIATPEPNPVVPPWYGKLAYRLLPIRRAVVMENLNRVFGETLEPGQIVAIAEAFYGHHLKCSGEFLLLPFLSKSRKEALVRIEGGEHLEQARARGKGVLLLTGHFGNWEVATVAGISQFREYRGLFHFIRRPLKPEWLNDFVMRRFRKAGFGTLEKAGSLDEILDLLERNHIVVSIFDQFTVRKYGIPSEFFGHFAHTFKSPAVLAQFTGAPVVPASSWREPDGSHVLRFEAPVELVTEGRTRDLVSTNTKRFNEALERIVLRHPEQWIWMHRRWKPVKKKAKKNRVD